MKPTPLLAAIVCLGLRASDWPSIPPAVWALKEDAAKGIRGAVVLEDRLTFKGTYVEYRYRVRILSEQGRAAAEFKAFSEIAHDIHGRTVYPDGKVVTFDKRKDFASKTTSVGEFSGSRTVLVPPGVNSDCVVEITWMESANTPWSPLPGYMGRSTTFTLANRFPTQEMVVEVPRTFQYAHALFPAKANKPEVTEKGGMKIYTFRNIPANEEVPYGLEAARDLPRLMVYEVPEILQTSTRGTTQEYWKQVGNAYLKGLFVDDVSKGSNYRALISQLGSGLTTGPQARAATILMRLEAQVRNLDNPTYAEEGKATKKERDRDERALSLDLDAAAKQGSTNASGMTYLFFNALRDLGIPAKVCMVKDRDLGLFSYSAMNTFQFSHFLIGVEEPGKGIAWFEPGRRFAPPGMVHPDFQGTPGLMFDPKDWNPTPINIPAQMPQLNVSQFETELWVEDEMDRFKVTAAFTGYPEYRERTKFMKLEPKEQARNLKESFVGRNAATISLAEVKGATDPAVNLSWKVEGQIEREEGRSREVFPFPGVPWASWVPDAWPEQRLEPILMPWLRIQRNQAVIHLAKGLKWEAGEPWVKENRFGKVTWEAKNVEENQVKVSMQVEVRRFFEPAAGYEDLKIFLGWVKEASTRSLLLHR